MNEEKLIQIINNQGKEIEKLKAHLQKMSYENDKQKDRINSQIRTINNMEARISKLESILSRRLR
jgi:predicted RNase H-like nuclease (RuvC/YqgF family)